MIVGSLRRMRPTCRDIDLVAGMPTPPSDGKWLPVDDRLFMSINQVVTNPWGAKTEPGLFQTAQTDSSEQSRRRIGYAKSGLQPGFLCCSLVLVPEEGIEIPCQIWRHTPRNRGWCIIQRTGPAEFGRWFLGEWKRTHRIPIGDQEHRASIDGHLVDASGHVVPVATEEEAFEKAGLKYIPPHMRDVHLDNMRLARREDFR